jgi:hypothetical protein
MNSWALNLDTLIADLKEELDSSLRDAKDLDRIYENGLREICLELLSREKRLATEEGELGTLIGGGIASVVKRDWKAYTRAHAALDRERQSAVDMVEAQEKAVRSATPYDMKQSLEPYLAKRSDPINYFVHVPFRFAVTGYAARNASGKEGEKGRLTIRSPQGSPQPLARREDNQEESA